VSAVREVTLLATTSLKGNGRDNNIFRNVYELWTHDGRLVASYDPVGKDPSLHDSRDIGAVLCDAERGEAVVNGTVMDELCSSIRWPH